MASVKQTRTTTESSKEKTAADLGAAIFAVAADRLADRAGDAALFSETGRDWQAWLNWELLAACIGAGWAAEPHAPYTRVGIAGSRELADLLVFDPSTGCRVVIELAIVTDWTTNKWIADLNGDTDRLRKAAAVGVAGLQLIVAASLTSAVELNETGRAWLAMSEIWSVPTKLERAVPMGSVGQILARGWERPPIS
jgi:hypothetical protein